MKIVWEHHDIRAGLIVIKNHHDDGAWIVENTRIVGDQDALRYALLNPSNGLIWTDFMTQSDMAVFLNTNGYEPTTYSYKTISKFN